MTKYKNIYDRYKKSGLTQKSFAHQEGISPSMVCYYIKRARQEMNIGDILNGKFKDFAPIQITTSGSEGRFIRITTIKGLEITIPI